MSTTLAAAAKELAAEITADDYPDPTERADRIATELGTIRPDTTARSRQRAAAAAVGIEPEALTGTQAAANVADMETARRRRAAKTIKTARRTATRAARTSGIGNLIVTSIALALAYNLIRSADRFAGFADGINRAIEWLSNPYAGVLDRAAAPPATDTAAAGGGGGFTGGNDTPPTGGGGGGGGAW